MSTNSSRPIQRHRRNNPSSESNAWKYAGAVVAICIVGAVLRFYPSVPITKQISPVEKMASPSASKPDKKASFPSSYSVMASTKGCAKWYKWQPISTCPKFDIAFCPRMSQIANRNIWDDMVALDAKLTNASSSHVPGYGLWQYPAEEHTFVEVILGDYCKKHELNGVVFDIGSNVGYYSVLSRACGCKAFAFDGNNMGLDLLRMDANKNGWKPSELHVVNKLVSAKCAVTKDGWGTSGCTSASNSTWTSIDKYVEEHVTKDDTIVYVKIDVQGHELSVAQSGLKTMRDSSRTPMFVAIEVQVHHPGYQILLNTLCSMKFSCFDAEKVDPQMTTGKDLSRNKWPFVTCGKNVTDLYSDCKGAAIGDCERYWFCSPEKYNDAQGTVILKGANMMKEKKAKADK